ncbi:MAG: helix-turn-helix transcriptional regulator [Clostridia bacterium]|nr:helix-turn-helix transcriptional regulator [Clostridia bacterium]
MKKENISLILGNRIKELRTNAQYSQESFADKIGVHRTYMGAIERGEKNITILTAQKIANGLGISISELLKKI